MKSGTLTLADNNGNVLGTYRTNTGGRGRGPLPVGDYTITNGRVRYDKPTMISDGVGYSFDVNPQFRTDRSALRIHPDGMNPGTIGCLGIMGNAAVQKDFYSKMQRLIRENGGSYRLQVRDGGSPRGDSRQNVSDGGSHSRSTSSTRTASAERSGSGRSTGSGSESRTSNSDTNTRSGSKETESPPAKETQTVSNDTSSSSSPSDTSSVETA
jgi:hypothetical protein